MPGATCAPRPLPVGMQEVYKKRIHSRRRKALLPCPCLHHVRAARVFALFPRWVGDMSRVVSVVGEGCVASAPPTLSVWMHRVMTRFLTVR